MATPPSTTNLRVPRFPHEIFEFIIDFIGYDEYDGRVEWLHWCSLVCSSWEYRARPHLLRVVRLGNTRHVESLHQALLQKPHYRPLIRTLKFRFPRRDHLSTKPRLARDAFDNLSTVWFSEAISKIPRLLPNLYKLEFHRLPSFDIIQSELPRFCRRFGNIRSLRLGHLTEQTFYQIVHIINEIRGLRSVEISDCSWEQFGRVHPFQQRRLSEVYLDLRPDFEGAISAWMIQSDSLSALRSLTWWSYKESRDQISRILKCCEQTLREATMTIYIPEGQLRE
ncbi:hypothetical protein NLI96_g8525 [Meripilus lineatus]|uniref:F-box domain-containing protein n=1 Tax=Meripilus lineatus TaxID=2056292 RepID=A0AAD5UXF3_9APHY|nr:hypothetical protein NLI96_g8525 [Physisporinus lineatus]